MKKIIGLLIFVLSFTACRREDTTVPFRAYVEIPAGLNTTMTHNFIIRGLQGVPDWNISEAYPSFVRLTAEDGEGNMDFVRRAYLSHTNGTVVQEMAYNIDVPFAGLRTVDLYPSILEMKDAIRTDSMDVILKLELRSITSLNTRLRVDFGVAVTLEE